ncbi:hypothetical protein AB0F72_07855 [Actinoplanes sp. NPDC023936]|uniref:hypothetical protein n=1 Tax=Actinoplanes sp. NPDC023936 TaxID=3154910 RepID=UPI0033E34BC6
MLAGREEGRQSPEQITLFNSVGVGLQDLATARLLIDEAVRRGLGSRWTSRCEAAGLPVSAVRHRSGT